MSSKAVHISVDWHKQRWYSPYYAGAIKSSDVAIDRIYRHKKSGQIRIYSPNNLNGSVVKVNDETVVMYARGFYGKLYISA